MSNHSRDQELRGNVVERVGRAVAVAIWNLKYPADAFPEDHDMRPDEGAAILLTGRVAIEALRELSTSERRCLAQAAERAEPDSDGTDWEWREADLISAWPAMIDAALGEPS